MLKVIPNGENRVDLELDGKLEADDMAQALDALIEATSDVRHGRMLYRIPRLSLPSFGALAGEISRLPQLFGLISKFDRVAVLTNKKWVQRASELEGALFPGVEIKAFKLDEEAAAEAWLSQ